MVQPRRSVPRQTDVPFHVRIVSKQLAVVVKGHVELVAETTGDDFPAPSVGIGPQDVSDSQFIDRVARLRQQVVVLRITIGRIGCHTFWERYVVAVDDVQHVVRPEHNLIGTVTVTALVVHELELLHVVKAVIAIGIAQTIEAAAIGSANVDAVVRVEHSATMLQRVLQHLELIDAATIRT